MIRGPQVFDVPERIFDDLVHFSLNIPSDTNEQQCIHFYWLGHRQMGITQLGVCEMIHGNDTQLTYTIRKPQVPTLKARVLRYLPISAHAFLCNNVLYLPSKFLHEVLCHPIEEYLSVRIVRLHFSALVIRLI